MVACDVVALLEEEVTSEIDGMPVEVMEVIDGDTIVVDYDGFETTVRYIGVDTPERNEPYYQEATDFNRSLVGRQTIYLVKDVSEVDQYGRLLRYIYLPDGTFVNGELIANGYARLVTFPPDVAQTDYLADLQREARNGNLGLWGIGSHAEEADLLRNAPAGCETCSRNAYNCRDFNSQSEAQACYGFCLDAVGEDIHRLDGGGDGLVCESLK